jgi:hypothetical protein
MVHVLEGTSVALATQAAEAMQGALALPPAAFTYLTSHGSLDLQHVRFFESLLERLDAEEGRHVLHVAKAVYGLYAGIFRGLPS